MRPTTLKLRRALGALCACALAMTLSAPAAFADTQNAASAAVPQNYEGTKYTVTIYAGNQGSVYADTQAAGDDRSKAVFENWDPAVPFDFSEIILEVPEDSKYYAKGLRLAGLDNIRSNNIRGEEIVATQLYANVDENGGLSGSPVAVTEDMDFVVAYGIKANRVLYTVNYVDANGNELAASKRIYGDVGDVPATAAAYVDGYVPRATVLTKTLSSNEAENVITFTYDKLADGFTTQPNQNGGVDVVAPDGSTAPDAYVTEVARPVEEAAIEVTGAGADATDEGGQGVADQATDVEGLTAAAGAADGPGEPLVTDNGTVVLDDSGTPLAAPGEESLDDEEAPLASGQTLQGEQPQADMAWLPWGIGAVVLLAAIVFVLVRARKQTQQES